MPTFQILSVEMVTLMDYQDDIKQTTSQRLRELAGVEQLQQRRDGLEAQATRASPVI